MDFTSRKRLLRKPVHLHNRSHRTAAFKYPQKTFSPSLFLRTKSQASQFLDNVASNLLETDNLCFKLLSMSLFSLMGHFSELANVK